ncbi:LolA-like putative outer membrane lipoprotein chaperone [Prevotella sp. P6B1]|uniref:LolA-like putative outer membrane lipoprotein chaperone n=1 Tax=Prevotella sp. P6B1 TaxID=1410613 RepID=UPI00068925D1|nr:LolA-like putative outer membrane lipoprotein chaperone [Prevotella sp. P6B1]
MKRIGLIRVAVVALFTMHCSLLTCYAQSAKTVLDKAAASITAQTGVKANFKMTATSGNTSGTIAIKGKKFYATTPQATVWFDGKTQWTYMKHNDEVNVSNPTEAQLQAINPYNFIHLYKRGYAYTMNTTGNNYVVHLTANSNERKIKELFISVDKKSYQPTQVKLLQGKKWTTFDISNIKKEKLADSQFKFNSKDFPKAEIIDLR